MTDEGFVFIGNCVRKLKIILDNIITVCYIFNVNYKYKEEQDEGKRIFVT